MDTAENEDPAALCRKRIDDRLDLSQGLASVKLSLHIIFALQQFQVGNGFETHHLVTACGVDHQIAGYGEEISPTGRHIFPIFSGIGAGEYLRDHVFQFLIGRQDPPEAPSESSFLW